ncbi:AAA family ATPase [Mycoplasmopsis gallinarum]|uniref:Chromosome partition protein Smc n=1 Tax=Mycoplasmopsis gallinarum TaxID=29557 RepID=A0A168R788_9BACT|nr:AAA family ATPase [Mycoplasmopsis gallinarum]OAB48671.1 Chromosome partition protein smc [Mycoplasmopsis gallinarum]
MKLIKVEAHGFKSFADPITLKFDGGVAGIVGPNGSGKSNINDAIKWVLGERSAKELRGDNMADVIFAGSKTAKPMDKAVVTLTFDNKDGLSSLPHQTITISRVLERNSGINQYYLNGEVCRQKDIKDIAMESGIGKSSLAIISQGTVSDIAEATPEERKAIFEEAAGVSKYKFRKKEALSKLAKTEEGLEQIRIRISEIERKLIPLRKQAEKAKIYIAKAEELKSVEVGLLVDNIKFFGKLYNDLKIELEGVDETRQDLEERIEILSSKILNNNQQKSSLSNELKTLSVDFDTVKEQLNKLDILLAKEEERHKLIADGINNSNAEEQIKSYQELIKQYGARINAAIKDIEIIDQKISTNNQQIDDYNAQINELSVKINKQRTALVQSETTLNLLLQQKENSSFLHKGTKTILDNKALFGKSLKGTVADLIKVPKEYVTAIDTILASSVQHLVVDKAETAVKAVNFLKNNNGGRATFIPLASIQPKSVRDDHLLAIQSYSGFIGVASDLVEAPVEYTLLVKFLLGNVLVSETIEDAKNLSNILEKRYLVVTLDGDTVRAGGVISGGAKIQNQSLLNIEDKIKDLETIIPGMKGTIRTIQEQIDEITNKRRYTYELDSQFKQQKSGLVTAKATNQDLFNEYNQKLTSLNRQQSINLNEINVEQNSNIANREVLENRKLAIEAEYRAKYGALQNISTELNNNQMLKDDLEATLRKILTSYSNKTSERDKSKLLLEQSKERLASHYKMTLETAELSYKLELKRDQAEEIVHQLREEIEALGNVNLESLEALVEEEERYNENTKGEAELTKAKEILENAIAEFDKIIISRLSNIVNDVNEEFNNVFQSMFGGGRAKLHFTDPNNILESGVEIEAQPPGKSIKNLKLFSGGEKSLIAISLLFGILKARPLPLCILDEVEAALDEANVVRYAEYLQQLKPKTQFLVITHRHGTMSRVDSLFGATMQNRGVTTFISLELSEAKKLVEDEQKDYEDLEKGSVLTNQKLENENKTENN